jgi:hypothetical protein
MSATRVRRRSPGQLSLGFEEDPLAICDVLMAQIRRESPVARLIPEMGVCQGVVRIDLAAIGNQLDGYEIKGERDDLSRLAGQAAVYGQVFDRLTLVASGRHLEDAAELLPEWWGLSLVDADKCAIQTVRLAAANPTRDPHAIVRLLWREETVAALEPHLGRRPRTPRAGLWRQLVELTPPDELRDLVCRSLRERTDWRAAG